MKQVKPLPEPHSSSAPEEVIANALAQGEAAIAVLLSYAQSSTAVAAEAHANLQQLAVYASSLT